MAAPWRFSSLPSVRLKSRNLKAASVFIATMEVSVRPQQLMAPVTFKDEKCQHTWNSWKVRNLRTCLLQHGNLQYHNQYTIRLTFIIFTSTYYTCLLTRMCWNAWILVFEGFFQLLHLLVGGRAAVAPNCTIGQSASLQF